jgi:acyl-coenzyme A thioesterase PaaI-like protein
MDKPIQAYYNPATAICYGCGTNNPHGLHIQTHWNGTEGICHFTPHPEHTAFPGYVYGGLLASLIDCHSIGTAIAALYDRLGQAYGSEPEITCVTGSLNVKYLKPTPIGAELIVKTRIQAITDKKVVVLSSVYVGETECVQGEVVAVRVPSRMME